MRFRLLPALAVALLVAPITAQKVCVSANVNAKPPFQGTVVNAWFALPIAIANPTTITAADFLLSTPTRAPNDGSAQVGIWDDAGGKPGKVLAQVSVVVSRGVPGWYGGKFASPIVVTQPATYYVAFRNLSGVTPGISQNGVRTPYFWGPPVFTTWRGPINVYAWSYRVYCGTHGGAFAGYGSAGAGTGSIAPRIRGLGQPNTTNTAHVQVSLGLGGAPSVLFLGTRGAIRTPFGDLLAIPGVVAPQLLAGSGAGGGHATLDLALPNAAALKGVKVAFQSWILDPGAAAGLSHTPGLEMTIGH